MRDSRTGYLIPARNGMGLWPDRKIVGAPPSASSASSGKSLQNVTGYLLSARDGPGALPDGQSSWDTAVAVVAVAAVAVIWKFRLTFRPRNYIWSFPMEVSPGESF